METVSKKRGRPKAEARIYGESGAAMMASNKQLFPELTGRSATNRLYYMAGFDIACKYMGKEQVKKIFFRENGRVYGSCILEQIGRMNLQNNYNEESCKEILNISIEMLQNGFSIRSIEKYIRHGRNTNEW